MPDKFSLDEQFAAFRDHRQPRGVEHRPVAAEEAEIVRFEPAGTLNPGNVRDARTVDAPGRP